jgi:hypothetical protein
MHPEILNIENEINRGRELSASRIQGLRNIIKKSTKPDEIKKGEELLARYEGNKEQYRPQGSTSARPQHGRGPRDQRGGPWQGRGNYGGGGGQPPARVDNASGADPSVLGEPFHNPYTFIPFPSEAPERTAPTPITIDEEESDRFTGVLDLEIELLSPLLTNSPIHTSEVERHKTYEALTIGNDVVVPATGVRGALRSLLSIITGGTLSHVDEEAFLCQGRDARLGPAANATRGKVPDHAILGKVTKPGKLGRSGKILLGKTKLIKTDLIEQLAQRAGIHRLPRPEAGGRGESLWMDDDCTHVSQQKDARHPWEIKLSGRPINRKGKREGAFLASGKEIEVSGSLWTAYTGRNRHGDHPELRKDDLVWLEPTSIEIKEIESDRQIKSIQWARWGRTGERLLDVIASKHPHLLPDAFNPDGKVDEVTNLFGQVPRADLLKEVPAFKAAKEAGQPGPAGPFAGRIRFGNLIFADAKPRVEQVTLAPLAPPHPGCAAFYRDPQTTEKGAAADCVANKNFPLRGFKVYRTTSERGADAPWRYDVQGVYDPNGRLQRPQQKVNKTVELLPESSGIKGRIRLTLRALSAKEIGLLLSACTVDWRLGGGKPLGLGHCRVSNVRLQKFTLDGDLVETCALHRADGVMPPLPDKYGQALAGCAELIERMNMWQASQQAVSRLRYPRAVQENRNRKSRGGHVWFARHAQPRKTVRDGDIPRGLQVCHVGGDLQQQAGSSHVMAQVLPVFDPAAPQSDCLYGYDLFAGEGPEWAEKRGNLETHHIKFEPFDPVRHARERDRSGGFHGQNRDRRRDQRGRR